MEIRDATSEDWDGIWPFLRQITNERAVALWRSLGFSVIGTVPEAFHHPTHGYVGPHVMHRFI